jgi:uncharacterized Zn finger protein (UPF0148 family)
MSKAPFLFTCPCNACEQVDTSKKPATVVKWHMRKEGITGATFTCPCPRCNYLKEPKSIGTIMRHAEAMTTSDHDTDSNDDHDDIHDEEQPLDDMPADEESADDMPADEESADDMPADEESADDTSDAEHMLEDMSDAGNMSDDDNVPQPGDDWINPSLQQITDALSSFAKGMIEGIGQGRINQTGANFVLTLMKDTIMRYTAPGIREGLPSDWRSLKNIADLSEPGHWYEHFCPEDHHMFDADDLSDVHCPICEEDTRFLEGKYKRPAREALYYSFEDWVKTMYDHEETRHHLRGWRGKVHSEDGLYADVYDGSILSGSAGIDLFADVDDNDDVIVLSLCADATVIQSTLATNLTPLICDVLSFPYHLRKVFTAKYFGGVLPAGAKANNLFYGPMVRDLAQFRPGTAGIQMDGFKVFVTIAWLINDLRGIAGPFNACETGAIHGACSQCGVVGTSIKTLKVVCYLCATRHTPVRGSARKNFKKAYEKLPAIANLATLPPPITTTHAAAQTSALAAEEIQSRPKIHGTGEQNKRELQKQIMKGQNVFTQEFGTDCVIQCKSDDAHAIANTTKEILQLIRHTHGTVYVSRKRKKFTDYVGQTTKGQRPLWQATQESIEHVDEKVIPNLRLPSTWAGLPKIKNLNTSQHMLLGGPLGTYLLQFYDIAPSLKAM